MTALCKNTRGVFLLKGFHGCVLWAVEDLRSGVIIAVITFVDLPADLESISSLQGVNWGKEYSIVGQRCTSLLSTVGLPINHSQSVSSIVN